MHWTRSLSNSRPATSSWSFGEIPDGWTVVTKDHSLSAQWEHTVLITEDGYEVLTLGAADRS